MDVLSKVKLLLGIEDNSLDTKLNLIIENVTDRLKLLIGVSLYTDDIPEELTFIVTEVSVSRYNRLGSEGLSTHIVEGEHASFADTDFSPYKAEIQAYLDSQKADDEKVVFL